MRRIGGWFLALGCVVVLARAPQALAAEWLYTVRPGDTLWDVSESYLIDTGYWQRLQALNQVADPQDLPPGSRLRIPVAWMRIKPAPARIMAVEGEATVQSADGQHRTAAVEDMAIEPGDEVTTAADSSVSLEFADGSTLRVAAESRVVLDILSIAGGNAFADT
ncbi:MAG: LysM peptidoglycan-binding domain-containing protein, partial [Defluviicoccus sp.]|nr:LysM peptidoglycan-binding domain-containing protein [Defluviicoccus sp.]